MKKTLLATTTLLIFSIFLFRVFMEDTDQVEKAVSSEAEKAYPTDWLYQQRAYPHNRINYQAYQDAIRQTMLAKSVATNRSNEDWEVAGPVNTGGRITDVALHPTDQNIIYAGASVGGVFKSTDAGITWSAVFEDEGVLTIGNIALAPSDPEIVYVGTGEANGSATSGAFFGNGVYRSDNGGESWNYIGLEQSQHIGRIVVDPEDPERVFVAAAGLLYGKSEDKGLYRTTDGGQNWEQVLFVSDSTSCIDLAINPEDPDMLYAATWERIRRPWQRSYGGLTSRIYRSLDGGDTWQQLTNGLPPNDAERGRIGLAIAPSDPNIIYATYTTNAITNIFDGVYKSTDGGDNWIRVDDGSINSVYASFGWFFGNIRVHPTDPDVVYVLGVPLIRSTDGGVSWVNVTETMHVDQHGLEIHPQNPDFVVAGNDGGIYLSQTGGLVWEHVKTLPITQFYECEIDYLQPDRLYGGTQDNGTVRTLNGDIDNWQRILGGDGFHVIVDPTDNNYVYAESQWGNLRRSVNGGGSFNFSFQGGPGDRTNWNTPVVMDPTDPQILYYGANRLYRSVDRGVNWLPISEDLTDGQHPSGSQSWGTITSIAVAPADPNVVYTGTDDGNVQVTQDGGFSWTNISAGLPDRYITEVAVDPLMPSIAYLTLSGYKFVDYQPHVLRTTDFGHNWEDISGNLPEIPVNDIIIDPEQEGTLYIANDLGVWYTTDLGLNWQVLGNNLPMTIVNDLDLHPETRVLIAATFGRSIQKYELGEVIMVDADEVRTDDEYQLEVSPNPVGREAAVQFQLPYATEVRMDVLSISGQQISTIADQEFEGGKHRIVWNPSGLASGYYLLRLYTRDKILIKKVGLSSGFGH